MSEIDSYPNTKTPFEGVSIIIPAWNDSGVIVNTLKALQHELTKSTNITVIIVAGGPDSTFEIVQTWINQQTCLSWKVLRQQPRGKNAAINQALQIIKKGIIIFLDADTQVCSGWLEAITKPIKQTQTAAASGHFSPYKKTTVTTLFELDQLVSQEIHQDNNLFGGASIALSYEALLAIGGQLPEDVPVGVDWDLSQRVVAKGLERKYVKEAVVYTEIPQNWVEYWKNEVRWRRALLAWELRGFSPAQNYFKNLFSLFLQPTIHALLLLGWLPLLTMAWLLKIKLWWAFAAWFAFISLVLVRHLWRCVEAYRYTHSVRWLKAMPIYGLALFLTAAASWQAIFTFHKISQHFKGRRSQPQVYNQKLNKSEDL